MEDNIPYCRRALSTKSYPGESARVRNTTQISKFIQISNSDIWLAGLSGLQFNNSDTIIGYSDLFHHFWRRRSPVEVLVSIPAIIFSPYVMAKMNGASNM